MNIDEFEKEILFTGNIVQDSDTTIGWPERENRFNRYLELLDSINGTEGIYFARAIIKSMQADSDYGAYQTTQRVLGKFPSQIYIEAIILELPDLIKNNSEWAGEILCGLANSVNTKYEDDIVLFNEKLSNSDSTSCRIILGYIHQQEIDGWLDHRVGVLGVNA